MASLTNDGSPYNIETFCGENAQWQKIEIARLVRVLKPSFTTPDNNTATRRATYQKLIT